MAVLYGDATLSDALWQNWKDILSSLLPGMRS